MEHQLHPTALVEEPLRDQQIATRQHPERGTAGPEVRDDLLRSPRAHRGLFGQPAGDVLGVLAGADPAIDLTTQRAHLVGKLARARGRLAEPERNRRWLPASVLDQDLGGLDPTDPPRRIAELKDVTRRAIDREVLVDGSDRSL